MIKQLSLRIWGTMVLLAFLPSCGVAHNTHATGLRNNYISIMKDAVNHEHNHDYLTAIRIFSEASAHTNDLYPDLRNQGKIACHNRMAVCYRALGRFKEARTQLEISIALGDKKYAPKALRKLPPQ